MKPTACALLMLLGACLLTVEASAHCQVPCGIYDDHARIHAMQEDASTIAKAVKKLNASADKTDARTTQLKTCASQKRPPQNRRALKEFLAKYRFAFC